MVAFEIVLTPHSVEPLATNPLAPQSSAPTGPQLLGWGLVRPFKVGTDLPESGGGKTVPVASIEVAQGTPRALLVIDEPFERILLAITYLYFQVDSQLKSNAYESKRNAPRFSSSNALRQCLPSASRALDAHAAHRLRALHRGEHAGRLERARAGHTALVQRQRPWCEL